MNKKNVPTLTLYIDSQIRPLLNLDATLVKEPVACSLKEAGSSAFVLDHGTTPIKARHHFENAFILRGSRNKC